MQEKPSYETLEKRVQQLEAALAQRERILDHLPHHVLIQDTDHTILWANQAACRSLDCDRQAVLGGKCHELWNQSAEPCLDCPMSRSLESGTWESVEKQTPDGRYWRVRCLPLSDGQGEIRSILEVTEDISQTLQNREAQRQAEIALRKSEERYRLLVEQANEAILVAQKGGVVFANPKAEALFGYSKEALSARPLTEFIHEADREMVGERHERRLEGERLPDVYSFRIIHKSKAIRWVELKVARFTWNHKPATLCFFTDITQRKQSEAALQESEKVMRYIIRYDPNAIAVYDRNLRYIAVSDRYLEDYNVADRSILGKHHYEVFPEMPQRWKDLHQRVLEGAIERNDDDSFVRPDGSVTYNRWECRPWYRGDGSIGGMITYTEVTTERKLAEKALKESEKQHRIIFQKSPIGLNRLRSDGVILDCNEAFVRIMGATREKIIGINAVKMSPPKMRQVIQKALAGETAIFEDEYTSVTAGKTRFLRAIFSPITPGSSPGEVISTVEDVTERKEAEKALQESRNKYQTLFELANDAIFVACTQTGTLLDANQKAEQLTGRSREQIIGMHQSDLHPPAQRQSAKTAFQAEAQKPRDAIYDHLFVQHSNGRAIPVEISNSFIEMEKRPCFLGIFRDVSEQRKAQQTLRQYEAIVTAVIDPVSYVDREYIYQIVNDAYGRYSNRPKEAIMGAPIREVMGEKQFETIVRPFLDRCFAGEPVRYESWFFLPDGTPKYMEVCYYPMFDETGGDILGASVFSRDRTAQKKAEEALLKSERKYRLLADNVEDIIWTLNADLTHYTYVSPSVERLLGYSAKEVMEKGFGDCTLPESFIKIQKELIKGQEAGARADRILRLEGACLTKDGQQVYVESVTRPLWDADGGFDGIVGVSRDITARKQAEETIRQLQKAESLARMAGAIAHHFNNMLAAVIGNLELANDELSPETALFDNIVQAQKAAYRASDMSQLMLTYLGHHPTRSKPLDLSAACREYLKALRQTVSEQVALETRFPAAGPIVCADAAQMEQVLKALVTNAWEAMAENRPSRIAVSIGTVASAAIAHAHRYPVEWNPRQSRYGYMSVSDSGKGMAPEFVGNIFDPFFSDKFTGRGLGLAVALGLVKAQGGCITVKSAPGQGSTFTVFLPLSKKPCKPAGDKRSEGLKTTQETVLVAEDQPLVRNTAISMLKRLGFDVLVAKDGGEAVDIFRKRAADVSVVFSDLTMPGMNGWQTLAELRGIQPDIPVILTSGYNESQVMADAHEHEPQAFLRKPYQMKALKETLERVLGR